MLVGQLVLMMMMMPFGQLDHMLLHVPVVLAFRVVWTCVLVLVVVLVLLLVPVLVVVLVLAVARSLFVAVLVLMLAELPEGLQMCVLGAVLVEPLVFE